MTFVKQTLKNTASLLLAVWIIGTAYAAISTVSSGDPLTADSWNTIVNKLNNTDTNSTDLVTKSYVDSAVSAAGGSLTCEPITSNSSADTCGMSYMELCQHQWYDYVLPSDYYRYYKPTGWICNSNATHSTSQDAFYKNASYMPSPTGARPAWCCKD